LDDLEGRTEEDSEGIFEMSMLQKTYVTSQEETTFIIIIIIIILQSRLK